MVFRARTTLAGHLIFSVASVDLVSLNVCQHCSCTSVHILCTPANVVTSALAQVFSRTVIHGIESQHSFNCFLFILAALVQFHALRHRSTCCRRSSFGKNSQTRFASGSVLTGCCKPETVACVCVSLMQWGLCSRCWRKGAAQCNNAMCASGDANLSTYAVTFFWRSDTLTTKCLVLIS